MSPRLLQCRALIAVLSILLSLAAPSALSNPPYQPNTVDTAARTTTAAMETFVSQVGIDKYTSPKVPKLEGCVQDILDMKSLLIKKFSVPANRFLTLIDEQATHDAIIAG